MKKWTKTALLTGCACCIAGAVLMFSGWASGGKAYAETYDLNAISPFLSTITTVQTRRATTASTA